MAAEHCFTIQIHGEWSGRSDVVDEDFEADTIEEVCDVITHHVPDGVYFVVNDDFTSFHYEGCGKADVGGLIHFANERGVA